MTNFETYLLNDVLVMLLEKKENAHLVDALEYEPRPETPNNKFFMTLTTRALQLLQVSIANHNENGSKVVKIPQVRALPASDIALLMAAVYPIKYIELDETGTSDNSSMLGIYDYDTGLYDVSTQIFDNKFLLGNQNISSKTIKDAMSLLIMVSDVAHMNKEKHLVPVENGIFDKDTGTLREYTADDVFLSKSKTKYNPDATNPQLPNWDVESWLLELANDDEEVRDLFWQVIADSIQSNYSRGKAIFFYSERGNNGKGTFGQLIKNLVGAGRYSSLAIDDFKVPFRLGTLINSVVNIADENDSDTFIDSVKDFKASVTGDSIIVEKKFKDPMSYVYNGANIQMLNGLPKTKDKSGSFYRRILLIPFVKSFTNNGERPEIKQDYIYRDEVLEYVLKKALNLNFTSFIEPEVTKEALDMYREENDPVMQFWGELRDELQWDLVPTQFLYDLFVSWYKRNNPTGKTMGKRMFVQRMRSVLDEDDVFEDSFDAPVRSDGRMDDDEPLITEYELKNWYLQGSASGNMLQLRRFVRKTFYRGIVRV